jgi:hypothetical protein
MSELSVSPGKCINCGCPETWDGLEITLKYRRVCPKGPRQVAELPEKAWCCVACSFWIPALRVKNPCQVPRGERGEFASLFHDQQAQSEGAVQAAREAEVAGRQHDLPAKVYGDNGEREPVPGRPAIAPPDPQGQRQRALVKGWLATPAARIAYRPNQYRALELWAEGANQVDIPSMTDIPQPTFSRLKQSAVSKATIAGRK